MLLLIDNYDSFTYNLYHLIAGCGVEVEVVRNDALTVDQALDKQPQAVILSPGPGTPEQSGICLEMVSACANAALPLFGVCLGHQSLGAHFGGRITRLNTVVHGKTDQIVHTNRTIFNGIEQNLTATRYHSLVVERASLPDCLEITAETQDGAIMGLSHRTLPLHGVQFHPESIRTTTGRAMIENFLDLAGIERQALAT